MSVQLALRGSRGHLDSASRVTSERQNLPMRQRQTELFFFVFANTHHRHYQTFSNKVLKKNPKFTDWELRTKFTQIQNYNKNKKTEPNLNLKYAKKKNRIGKLDRITTHVTSQCDIYNLTQVCQLSELRHLTRTEFGAPLWRVSVATVIVP